MVLLLSINSESRIFGQAFNRGEAKENFDYEIIYSDKIYCQIKNEDSAKIHHFLNNLRPAKRNKNIENEFGYSFKIVDLQKKDNLTYTFVVSSLYENIENHLYVYSTDGHYSDIRSGDISFLFRMTKNGKAEICHKRKPEIGTIGAHNTH